MTMRVAGIAVLALVAGGACAAGPPARDTPEAVVERFYALCRAEKLSGLPDARQSARLAGLLSARLAALIEAARARQARYMREHPGEKPPLIEGDLFSSLFEGPTGFQVRAARIEGERARVTVDFSYREPPPRDGSARWSDDVLLVRERGDWRVDDVAYRGEWPFATSGLLSRNLAAPLE